MRGGSRVEDGTSLFLKSLLGTGKGVGWALPSRGGDLSYRRVVPALQSVPESSSPEGTTEESVGLMLEIPLHQASHRLPQ